MCRHFCFIWYYSSVVFSTHFPLLHLRRRWPLYLLLHLVRILVGSTVRTIRGSIMLFFHGWPVTQLPTATEAGCWVTLAQQREVGPLVWLMPRLNKPVSSPASFDRLVIGIDGDKEWSRWGELGVGFCSLGRTLIYAVLANLAWTPLVKILFESNGQGELKPGWLEDGARWAATEKLATCWKVRSLENIVGVLFLGKRLIHQKIIVNASSIWF